MDEKLRQTIINRIVAEVLHRIGQQAPKDEEVFGTVVLVTSFVPSKKSALDALRRNFMGQMEFIRFGVEFEPIKEKTYDIEESGETFVLDKVASAADLVLLTPKIGLMERIAMGEDEGFIEHLLTRSLLWGRRVTMLLDFTPPRFKRNTFFEKNCHNNCGVGRYGRGHCELPVCHTKRYKRAWACDRARGFSGT